MKGMKCVLYGLVTLLFQLQTASADDRNSIGNLAESESSLPSSSQIPLDQPQVAGHDSSKSAAPQRWTISAGAIFLDRVSGTHQTLVERVPGSVSFSSVQNTPGTQALNSRDFQQGFSTGPKIDLTYHGNSGNGVEVSYFQLLNWNSFRAIGPDNPPDWLVMKAPGGFFQTQDFTFQSMNWDYSSQLYNLEFNVNRNISSRLIVLAGFL